MWNVCVSSVCVEHVRGVCVTIYMYMCVCGGGGGGGGYLSGVCVWIVWRYMCVCVCNSTILTNLC